MPQSPQSDAEIALKPGKTLRIATRESPLAMWQATHVAELLRQKGIETEIIPLVSVGDTDMRPIDSTRQVGLFTKRIQQALVDGEADVAVHSLKDLPTEPDNRFTLAAVPPRESVLDGLVFAESFELAPFDAESSPKSALDVVPQGARIGTGSTRRLAQLKQLRPDLQVVAIRGNVQTRLAKLNAGEYDAIVLAHAGLLRLQLQALAHRLFTLNEMLPAPGQGALGIEVRSDQPEIAAAVSKLNDAAARSAVVAERTVLSQLHGGCLAPIACHATIDDSSSEAKAEARLCLHAMVLSADGVQKIQSQSSLAVALDNSDLKCDAARQLGTDVATDLRRQGADDLIRTVRGST